MGVIGVGVGGATSGMGGENELLSPGASSTASPGGIIGGPGGAISPGSSLPPVGGMAPSLALQPGTPGGPAPSLALQQPGTPVSTTKVWVPGG